MSYFTRVEDYKTYENSPTGDPSLREHLEAYGGTRMSPADFDRCEKDWYRMLGERRRMFDRYLLGMRCARYAVSGMWIIAFAIVGLTLVEVSS